MGFGFKLKILIKKNNNKEMELKVVNINWIHYIYILTLASITTKNKCVRIIYNKPNSKREHLNNNQIQGKVVVHKIHATPDISKWMMHQDFKGTNEDMSCIYWKEKPFIKMLLCSIWRKSVVTKFEWGSKIIKSKRKFTSKRIIMSLLLR